MILAPYAVHGVTVLAYSREHAESLTRGPSSPVYAFLEEGCPDTLDACPPTSRTPYSPKECYPVCQGSR